MSWSTTVLSSDTSDTDPTIIVTFDDAKYMFNASENTGRSWVQSQLHWRKTRGVFLTSVGTDRCSGLAGMLMFLADAGTDRVKVVGPYGLLHYVASMRSYLWRVSMDMVPVEAPPSTPRDTTPEPLYVDQNITLYGFPIHATVTSAEAGETEGATFVLAKRKRSRSPDGPAKRPNVLQSDSAGDDVGTDSKAVSIKKRLTSYKTLSTPLSATEAQEYRRLTIENMFPFKAPKEDQLSKHQKRKENRQLVIMQRQGLPVPSLSASQTPPVYNAAHVHRDSKLPPFSYDRDGKPTLCYVLVGPRVRGRFDKAKALELGIPQGPLFGRLTKGFPVTIMVDNGNGQKIERVVQPSDCIGPSEAPKVLIVLDVPSPSHIPELLASFAPNSFFSRFRSQAEKDCSEHVVHLVYHLCGRGVLEDERYKEFMRGFADETHHLVSSREHGSDRAAFTTAAFNQMRLHQLDVDVFPLPKITLEARRDLSLVPILPRNTELLYPYCTVDMRPPRAPRHDESVETTDHFHPNMASNKSPYIPVDVSAAFRKAKDQVARVSSHIKQTRPGDNVEIMPLGTSSALPTPYRNVSSTLVHISGYGYVMLDAGEGTWGQLARIHGDDVEARSTGAWKVLRNLRCIFLSHMHGDHHAGVAKILAMRRLLDPAPTRPLYVVGVPQHLVYLREQSELEDLGIDQADGRGVITILSDVISWRAFRPHPKDQWDGEAYLDPLSSFHACQEMCKDLGLESFTTVDVHHRAKCYGAVIKHRDGWSIVYSGDTMPTNNLVRAGENATLLIHEATMADNQQQLARDKAHSTYGQAVEIGRRMQAENILLTHFSARYYQMPPMNLSPPSSPRNGTLGGRPACPNVALAFDHARFTIGDMWKFQYYRPAIESHFRYIATTEGDDGEDISVASWES